MATKIITSKGASKILKYLSPIQQDAVIHTDKPILILAGAGSGKTRVLTHKIAYLIDIERVKPWTILAMTFTNKAAGEMKERIQKLTRKNSDAIWMGTFHSIFARILRREANFINYSASFSIYDTDDQRQLIKSIIEGMTIPIENFTPRAVQSHISRAKNKMISPEEYLNQAGNFFEDQVAPIYVKYQQRLRELNAMDFDDLLLYPIELFTQHATILEKYQNQFNYILIDEYQDTNRAQYQIIKLLSAQHRNICVVGDDDQSIYKWRGADINNILDFEKDFKDCRIFRLEQNYRSTRHILKVANSVVRNNMNRLEKTLWTDNAEGEKVTQLTCRSAWDEANKIVKYIQMEMTRHKRNFRDFAILYRTNAQSRIIEDILRNNAISYVIIGGIRFYERKEVKDVLAYLRLVVNPWDTISAKRVINYPLRGIGLATIKKIDKFAIHHRISFFEALKRIHEVESITASRKSRIYNFYKLMEKYQGLSTRLSVPELARAFVDEIEILHQFKNEGTVEAMSRYENVMELLSVITEFSKRHPNPTLAAFLEEVALITDIDTWDDRGNGITLMTIHAAKGLEFPVIFLTGIEEGLFPLSRNMDTDEEVEEERRLFYVGATRAKEKLYLSWAQLRGYGGQMHNCLPSRFILEIDEKSIVQEDISETESARKKSNAKSQTSEYEYDYDDDTGFIDDVPSISFFEVGMQVRHRMFGEGTITHIEGYGEKMKVTVQFELVGHKKLMVKYANLEII